VQDGVAARFERVEQHPGFAAVMARTLEVPASRRPGSALAQWVLSLAVFGVAAVFLAAFIPFGALLVGALGLFSIERLFHYRSALAQARAPVRPSLGVVERLGRASKVEHGFRSQSRLVVTLLDRSGRRRDFVADEALNGRLAEGDIGVAFLHAQALVDFVRFDV